MSQTQDWSRSREYPLELEKADWSLSQEDLLELEKAVYLPENPIDEKA